jgi:hypothetical protein
MYGKVSCCAFGLGLVATILGASGCGPSQFDVTGTVKYNGAPLQKPNGQIVFVGPTGVQVPADIDPDGTYRASRVSAGPNRVVVYYVNPKARKKPDHKLRPGEQPPPFEPPYLTPGKYADPASSGFSVEVRSGAVFDAELQGPKIP